VPWRPHGDALPPRQPRAALGGAQARPQRRVAVPLGVLLVFLVIETRVAEPMPRLSLFKAREFTAGNEVGNTGPSVLLGTLQP
jgi:hypothetical protein